jgi:hypothetical protein
MPFPESIFITTNPTIPCRHTAVLTKTWRHLLFMHTHIGHSYNNCRHTSCPYNGFFRMSGPKHERLTSIVNQNFLFLADDTPSRFVSLLYLAPLYGLVTSLLAWILVGTCGLCRICCLRYVLYHHCDSFGYSCMHSMYRSASVCLPHFHDVQYLYSFSTSHTYTH